MNGVLASILTVFQTFALLWIALLIVGVAFLVRALVQTRDSEWIRSQDEVERLARAVDPGPEKLATQPPAEEVA